jgi:integrase/recombinase XerD
MYTLEEATKEFIHHCIYEKNLSPKSIQSYKTDLTQLQRFLADKNYSAEVTCISKIELREYLELLSTLKPKSVKRKIAVIKAMFNYLEFEDKIRINPVRKMRIKIKEPVNLPRFLNTEEMLEIFKYAYRQTALKSKSSYSYTASIRDIAVIELLFATGARVSEIANLRDLDVNLDSGVITIIGKGNKQRILQVCNIDSLSLLKLYRKLFTDRIEISGGYFLVNRLNKKLSDQSIRTTIRVISHKALLNKYVTPHFFRHTFATLLLEKDVDIKYIQSLLGHSSIMTTQIYTHVNKEKQRQILKQKHPRKDFVLDSF